MRVTIGELNDGNLKRAAQLLNKTNQMNLSTRRMTEVELLSDRLVVVGNGRVLANGTVADLRRSTGKQDLEEAFMRATGTGEV